MQNAPKVGETSDLALVLFYGPLFTFLIDNVPFWVVRPTTWYDVVYRRAEGAGPTGFFDSMWNVGAGLSSPGRGGPVMLGQIKRGCMASSSTTYLINLIFIALLLPNPESSQHRPQLIILIQHALACILSDTFQTQSP